MRIETQTLSFNYSPVEDRMKLVINSDQEPVSFWITRRLYLSIIFELETFFQNLNIDCTYTAEKKMNETRKNNRTNKMIKDLNSSFYLLEHIKLRYLKEKKIVLLTFQADDFQIKTFFGMSKFLEIYFALKRSFPKQEWGII